ncbi:protein kinase [Streptomyces sp. NPDC047928]|uniref:protein kinase domain-containing protein n=1 Tax=unclassified Streptomyces TaxID=2593676 RepID=UPI00371EFC20
MAPESEAGGGGLSDGGASASDAAEFGVGGLVGDGRYRLTHRLGRGGMAEVFAAEDVRLGRTVAVKLLRPDLAEDPVSKARFTREAQSVAGLNHHAIVAVYDSGEDAVNGQSVPYIVMELVEGRTIRDLLMSAEAPGPEQALIIVSGVLEALAYSHQHGIVHRDIKPANVIITHSGAVKVMDFGIARALHGASTTMTQTGMVMGTPQYLSPEQALGKAVDHRSDLYATGCLLYELLASRPPFTGETPLSVVYQHVQDMPVPPSEAADVAPPELDGLAMRALAKDPDDRFQSAEEMRGLIQYALQMLQEQGSHTGTWSTGPVDMGDGGHPAHGGPVAATAVMGQVPGGHQGHGGHLGSTAHAGRPGHLMHGDTSQNPILPPPNPDDGAYDGYGGQGRRPGSGRGKVLLFVAFALVAMVAGVVYALGPGSGTKEGTKTPAPASGSPSPSDSSSPSPSASRSEENEDPDDSTGGNQDWNRPPYTPPQRTWSHDPSPSGSGSSDPGTTDGGTDGGTDEGTTEGGTEGSTEGGSQGTTEGGANSGTTDGGSGDTNGGTTTSGTTSGQQAGTTTGTSTGVTGGS